MVARAEAQAATGRLDEAAALLDVALDEGARAPLQVSDPPALVRALVTRATIGLARGEQDRAEALIARVLRYDPTFALAAHEETPRMLAAVERVRERLGPEAALSRDELGERCGSQTLLLARRLDARTIEYARYAGCQRVATARATEGTTDAALVAALGGPMAPAASTASAATGAHASRPVYRSVWRRGWFWGVALAVAVALAGASIGVWAATRGEAADASSWHVTPRF
jgi:hypothetical protein